MSGTRGSDDGSREDLRFRLYLGALSFGMTGIAYALLRTDAGVPAGRALLELGAAGLALATLIGATIRLGRRRREREAEE